MDTSDAVKTILAHAGQGSGEKCRTGFLGSLRPFLGIQVENFHEVMESIIACSAILQSESVRAVRLGAAIWDMCHQARVYGVDQRGLLRSNNLVTEEEVATLENYLDVIESATINLLLGQPVAFAIARYYTFLENADIPPESTRNSIRPLLDVLLTDEDSDYVEMATRLIGKWP